MIPSERIEQSIYLIRGHKVMLDFDLAELYGVTTKRLNEQVKRNRKRFPADFMFRLKHAETEALNRSQFATGRQKHRDPRQTPYAFTEHGAVMLASVLNSPIAVAASIQVVRAFIRLREVLATHKELVQKLKELEGRLGEHDVVIQQIFQAIQQLMEPPTKEQKQRQIGFSAE